MRVWVNEAVEAEVEVDGWAERRWSFSAVVSKDVSVVKDSGTYESE